MKTESIQTEMKYLAVEAVIRTQKEKGIIYIMDDNIPRLAVHIFQKISEMEKGMESAIGEEQKVSLLKKQLTKKEIVFNSVAEVIQKNTGVSIDEITQKTRKKEILIPRLLFMFFLWKLQYGTLSEIASKCVAEGQKKKHHATVLNAEKSLKKRIQKSDELKDMFNVISVELAEKFKEKAKILTYGK